MKTYKEWFEYAEISIDNCTSICKDDKNIILSVIREILNDYAEKSEKKDDEIMRCLYCWQDDCNCTRDDIESMS